MGFDDAFIFLELNTPPEKRAISMINLLPEEAFTHWEIKNDKIEY
ncbi:hypothetical protein SAMN06295888_10941 [Desulfonatronum zhilinae]|nr:hypothetical protein SAMN06295888_10941 [Desulfonatronum zhilinae]